MIEQFIASYRNDQAHLTDVVTRKAAEDKDSHHFVHSRAVTLANIFRIKGGEGLRSIDAQAHRYLGSERANIIPTADNFKQLPTAMQEGYVNNLHAVWFGTTLITVEDMLINKSFSAGTFASHYNEAVRGTQLQKIDPNVEFSSLTIDDGVDYLTDTRWHMMVQTANKDKTLQRFFHPDGFSTLPVSLQTFLNKRNILEPIRKDILPHYQAFAPNLLPRHEEVEIFRKEMAAKYKLNDASQSF